MRLDYDRLVIGYHGCDEAVAERLLRGEPFAPSTNDYDWLGHGVYFWEWGLDRAQKWARQMAEAGSIESPAVVGAWLQLGRCIDLLDTEYTAQLGEFFADWSAMMSQAGLPIPLNRGPAPEKGARFLDCAVLNAFARGLKDQGRGHDTVRGAFQEGGPAFPGSAILSRTHIQIAVRNPAAILGVFRPTGAITGGTT